jgi:hypothetical protein
LANGRLVAIQEEQGLDLLWEINVDLCANRMS